MGSWSTTCRWFRRLTASRAAEDCVPGSGDRSPRRIFVGNAMTVCLAIPADESGPPPDASDLTRDGIAPPLPGDPAVRVELEAVWRLPAWTRDAHGPGQVPSSFKTHRRRTPPPA